MKIRKVIVLSLILLFVTSGAVYASSRWGNFEGFSRVQVLVNNNVLSSGSVPAFIIKDATVLPLRDTAEALNAFIKWDAVNQTANLYKPNVNIIAARVINGKDYSTIRYPFGRVDKGSTMSFTVFIQVDSLFVSVDRSKLSVIDPHGNAVTFVDPQGNAVTSIEEDMINSQDNFWYVQPLRVTFSEAGSYTVQFALQADGKYVTVGEKLIVSEE